MHKTECRNKYNKEAYWDNTDRTPLHKRANKMPSSNCAQT